MSRNFRAPPPPPRTSTKPYTETIDSILDRDKDVNSMKNSSLNDIDGESIDPSEISDNDSVLAMAKRLDAASVISDPSFIEVTDPHVQGVDPGRRGGGGGGRGRGPPNSSYGGGRGGPGPGGLYARNRDLDSIASQSSSNSSSSSSSSMPAMACALRPLEMS